MKKLPLTSKQIAYLSVFLSGFNLIVFGLPVVLLSYGLKIGYLNFLFQPPFHYIYNYRGYFFVANAIILLVHVYDYVRGKKSQPEDAVHSLNGPEVKPESAPKKFLVISIVLYVATLIGFMF